MTVDLLAAAVTLPAGGAPEIPLARLALAFVPVAMLLAVFAAWNISIQKSLVATARMLGQLLAIGYVLVYIFGAKSPWVVLATLAVMLAAASWIAVRSLERDFDRGKLADAFAAITIAGASTLALVTQGVLALEPWYSPKETIALAGMIFANSMNAVSLAAERYLSERRNVAEPIAARNTALHAALIPLNNALLAVGIVSLPGMMTGQLLAGASPLTAARYQIMVMCMVFASGGLAAAIYLTLQGRRRG